MAVKRGFFQRPVSDQIVVGSGTPTGAQTYTGEFDIDNSTVLNTGGREMVVGSNSGGEGHVQIDNGSVLNNESVQFLAGDIELFEGTWNVANDITTSGGSDSRISITDKSFVDVDGRIQLGDNSNSSYTGHSSLELTFQFFTGARLDAKELYVGGSHSSGLDVGSAYFGVVEGTSAAVDDLVIGSTSSVVDAAGVASNFVQVSTGLGAAGEVSKFSKLVTNDLVIVGDKGAGHLKVEGGLVDSKDAQAFIGKSSGGDGVVEVVGAIENAVNFAAEWKTGALIVGDKGVGKLIIKPESVKAAVISTSGVVGNHKSGTVLITGNAAGTTEWRVSGDLSVGNKGTGVVRLDSNAQLLSSSAGLGVQAGADGKVILKGGSDWKHPTGGKVSIDIGVGASGILQIDGTSTVEGNVTVHTNGKLTGRNRVKGMVTMKETAQVLPGDDGGLGTIGEFVFEDGFDATLGGTLFVDLGAVGAPGIDYDQLVLESDALLGGTLDVDLINGFVPNTVYDFGVDHDINVLNGASVFEVVSIGGIRTNEFESLNPPEQQLPAGMTWKIHHGDLDGDGDDGVWVMVVQGDAPVAVADDYNTTHNYGIDTLAQFHPALLDNDYDPNGDSLDAVIDAYPANGTITWFDGDTGHFIYEPDVDFVGTDYFTYHATDGSNDSYTATVTINVTNNAPSTGDDSYFINHDTTLNENSPGVLGNDWDDDFDTLSAVLVDDVQNGTLVLNGDGSFDYTPDPGFVGFDYFTYAADDGFEQALATATIEVYNDEPIADDDYYDTDLDTPRVEGDPGVMWNDFDTDPLTAYITSLPSNGTLVDGAGNPLSIGSNFGGGFTYTPNTGFTGLDDFTYYVTDGIANSPDATVTIDVYDMSGGGSGGGPGGGPSMTANNDIFLTYQDTTLNEPAPGVLANDTGTGDAILDSGTLNGSITLNTDGSFTYVPNAGFFGMDTFTYYLDDGVEFSDIATVDIMVDEWQPLKAAGKEIEDSQSAALQRSQLSLIVSQAISQWDAVIDNAAIRKAMREVTFQVTDLPGNTLGLAGTATSTILIDSNAAGYGWYINTTPGENSEYIWNPLAKQYEALIGPAANGMDLLTVVLHELGHIAGLEDIDPGLTESGSIGDLMTSTLDIGVRRLVTKRHGFQVLVNQFNQLITDPPKDRDDLTVVEKRERRVSLDHLLADLSRYREKTSKTAEQDSLDAFFASSLLERELLKI